MDDESELFDSFADVDLINTDMKERSPWSANFKGHADSINNLVKTRVIPTKYGVL